MALALGQAGTLKPEIKLAQALSEYEALLDDNQKATMRMYRRQQPPKLSDVMRLTAEIDRDNSGRSSRCVGQRLTNILQSVQQFSCIADTIVGGSQSLIASGVWAAVKLTLQVASGWGSYFERLSALIMDVGRSSPRYEELAVLYSSSAGLQKVFCEYMVVVVGLCKKAIMFVRKPFLAQLPASFLKPFETEFGQLRAELDKLAATIHDEVLLASTKGQQLEIKYNSAFRSFMGKVSDKTSKDIADIKAFQRREKKVHFLNACSSYNHQTACKRARKLGTSSWIYNNSTYQGWARDSASSILWCTGILGAGKTVLTANVLENVVIQAPEAIVASFFCQYDDYESLKARTIIGSLIRQTLASLPAEAFDNLDTTEFTMLPADEMFQYIQKLLALHRKQCFIILDGMDECDQEELKTVTHFLEDILAANTTFHVFCSSRPDLYRHISGVLQPKYNISCSESNPEILRYIEDELGRRLESEDLCLGDPGLILNIRDALSKGSQGMFLWVYFQLKSICAESTDEAILEALDHLPRDMPETIRRFLKKLDLRSASSRDLCRRIFEILAACRRPLTLQELRDAVSVVPGLKRWDTKRFVNNIDKAVDCCGSLLMVDEEQSTVHFVHHSVKQYLLDNVASTDSGVYHVDATEADLTLGEVCVTYLSFDSLSMQLTRIETPTSPDIGTLPSAIIDRILPPSTSKRLALKLLKDRKSNYDFNSQLKSMTASNQGLRNQQTSGQVLQHPFLSYAQEHWLVHSRGFWHETQLTYPLWKELIAGERSTVTLPWHKTFAADPFVTPRNPAHAHSRYGAYLIPWDRIAWASAHDHGPIAWEALHELQSHILELPKDVFEDLATSMLHECRNFKGKYYAPALLLACSMQSIDHALQLLKHGVGADINSQDFRGQTPLMCAASCPHVQLVKRLLAANANVRMVDHSGRTVLHVAVEADYGIVDPEDGRLVFSRVPPDPITESTDVIELLLAHHDTDVNAKYPVVDEFGVVGFRTALGQAVARGLDGVVQLLLEHPDIEVNSRDLHSEKYIPSLTPNSDTGHMPPYPPWTPLQTAAYKGDVRVLRLLLGRNEVDINIEDDNSRTALHLAVANRHRDVVTILLTRPNIIRSRYQGWDKRTAYDWAVARDDKTAMDIIIRQ